MTNSRRLIQERLNLVKFLKNSPTKTVASIKSISVGEFSLLPVGRFLLEDQKTIELLAKWRNINVNAYPSRFNATKESTINWLDTQVIDCPSRILFLVVNAHGDPVGHMGLASIDSPISILEIDNVARWSNDLPSNTFSTCLKALIKWANSTMFVQGFSLRVFTDNARAIRFYEKNNFKKTKTIYMAIDPSSSKDFIRLVENSNDDAGESSETMLEMSYEEPIDTPPNSLILTAGPSISQYETFYAYDAALNGWNSNWSNYIDLLQQEFQEYIGVKHALATSSCTGALHIALTALGIGIGDEVIVPDQTWVATANAVRYVGATPIFVDINPDDWTINPSNIERSITSKTKAIIPVHMYGHPAKMEQVLQISEKYNLFVVEDAAPSIGAEYKGKKTGSFGHFSAFSFQGAKLMVTGEGGMLLTDDDNLYVAAKKVWDQGRNAQVNIPFWIDGKGLKYKMSNIQAAVGLGQLARIETLVAMKRRIFTWYKQYLSGNNQISLSSEAPDSRSIYWMTSIEVLESSPVNRDELIKLLKTDQIDTRPVFPAISQYPIWDREDLKPCPVSLHVGNNCMNLPSGVCLSQSQVKYVCSRINFYTGI
jgi:perosamine synthetase